MADTHKLEMDYKDYVSIILMIIGISIALLFISLLINGLLTSGSGESGFNIPFR
ncbi:MAG: hypothetical protein ACTSPY_13075 [Candidatus Helarchaeota archaeon]